VADVTAAAAVTEADAVDEARVAVVATVLAVVHIGDDFDDNAAAGVAGVGDAALAVLDRGTVLLAVHVDYEVAFAFVAAFGIRSTALEVVLDWMTEAR
jgi:nickel-dependent lactate racemase